MTTRTLKTLAAAAMLVAGMAASAQTTTAADLIAAGALGHASAVVNGTSFSAQGGNFDAKTVNGVTAVGVSGGASGAEIDIGQSITASFASLTRLTSFSLAFLFDGPEYGDVNEVAQVSLLGTNYFGRLTAVDSTTAIWSLYGSGTTVTNQSAATLSGAGVWTVTNPFGNIAGTGVRFEAAPGSPGLGCSNCANQSDYSVLAVSPVPEPSSYALALVGLLTVGWAARRRNNNAG